jgi:hypothetical protein
MSDSIIELVRQIVIKNMYWMSNMSQEVLILGDTHCW